MIPWLQILQNILSLMETRYNWSPAPAAAPVEFLPAYVSLFTWEKNTVENLKFYQLPPPTSHFYTPVPKIRAYFPNKLLS